MTPTINITRSNGEDPKIEIQFKFAMGKTITASMTPAQFGLAVTGRSEVPVDVRFRNLEVVHADTKSHALGYSQFDVEKLGTALIAFQEYAEFQRKEVGNKSRLLELLEENAVKAIDETGFKPATQTPLPPKI